LLGHSLAFGRLQSVIFPQAGKSAALAFLPAIMLDLAVLHLSMYRFEFGNVYWRGRDISDPVMRRDG
jgi:hypothetical protein